MEQGTPDKCKEALIEAIDEVLTLRELNMGNRLDEIEFTFGATRKEISAIATDLLKESLREARLVACHSFLRPLLKLTETAEQLSKIDEDWRRLHALLRIVRNSLTRCGLLPRIRKVPYDKRVRQTSLTEKIYFLQDVRFWAKERVKEESAEEPIVRYTRRDATSPS